MTGISFVDQASLLRYHQTMLADRERVDCYRDALREIVRPGDFVVDLGSGTGLLAFLACQAGAARVYAIERGPILRIARELAEANGFQDRIVFVEADSSRATLPEQAGVLISETLWNFGLGEGMVATIADARERFLEPGGRVMPASFEMVAAPFEDEAVYGRLALDPPDRDGLDFSLLRAYARNNVHVPAPLRADGLLSAPAVVQEFDLTADGPPEARGALSFTIERAGTVHGLAGWFSARLSPSVTLANPPGVEASSWRQAFLPFKNATDVRSGDVIDATVQTAAGGTVWHWTAELRSDGSSAEGTLVADQTTFFGFPLALEVAGLD